MRDDLFCQEKSQRPRGLLHHLVFRMSVIKEITLKVKIEFEVSESFRETKEPIKFSVSLNLWAPRTSF